MVMSRTRYAVISCRHCFIPRLVIVEHDAEPAVWLKGRGRLPEADGLGQVEVVAN